MPSPSFRQLIWILLFSVCGFAQVATMPVGQPKFQPLDGNGNPYSGGCVFTYNAGSVIQLASYTSSTGTVANSNPVILDSAGRADIWLGPYNYKMVLKSAGGINCASGSTIWTVDNIPGNVYAVNGTTGPSGTVTVGTVSTLPAGSAVTITNSGTPSAAVLNFGIPVGYVCNNTPAAWSALTNYVANNCAISGGQMWIALQASLNVTPVNGADWQSVTVDLASPGPIGGTTAAAGTFTAITGSSLTSTTTSPTQAVWPTTAAVVPGHVDIESGSSGTPTTAKYATKPEAYFSRYDATDASACVTGIADGCMAPIVRIDGANVSATTASSMNGLLVDLHSPKTTSTGTYGNNLTAITGLVWDTGGSNPNYTNLVPGNDNAGANYVPAACWKGTVDVDNTCARVVNGREIDVTNNTATDGVYDSSIGNRFLGLTINAYSTNATPKDLTSALGISTGTAGHGWKSGIVVGGVTQVGVTIPQISITNKPDVGIHLASQGAFGLVCGSGSKADAYNYDVPTNSAWSMVNPSTACILLDALRTGGSAGAAASNYLQWRTATGAATYKNFRSYLDTSQIWHLQTDQGGAFADVLTVTGTSGSVNASGNLVAGGGVYVQASGANGLILTGTPTGARSITIQDATQTLVGRDTTDTLTNKTLTSPVINTGISGTAINPSAGKAVCWKTATTLGYCSTAVGAGGDCTCN